MCKERELKYNEPWILQRADPYVYRHTDGYYYFTGSVPAYDRIALRRAKTLAELPEAEEVTIWVKHEKGIMSEHIWAPELHYLNGKWYVYFAGSDVPLLNNLHTDSPSLLVVVVFNIQHMYLVESVMVTELTSFISIEVVERTKRSSHKSSIYLSSVE